MTLTTDRMAKLVRDVVLEVDVGPLTPEEMTFVDLLQKDIAKAAEEGYVIEIPGEWPLLGVPPEPTDTTGGTPAGGKPEKK